jgi:hypothetical protein
MDAIRLFLRTNSFRSTPNEKLVTATFTRSLSNPDETDGSNNNLSLTTNDKESSSNEKLSSENIKSFLSTHPSSTSVLSHLPLLNMELETCSGLSTETPEKTKAAIIAASASESISNVRVFTNRRRSSLPTHKRRQRRRSSLSEQQIHSTVPLSSPFRRINSHRYPDRIKKHPVKLIYATEKLKRRYIQVNE